MCVEWGKSEKKNLNFIFFCWAIIIDNYLECGLRMMEIITAVVFQFVWQTMRDSNFVNPW